MQDEGDREIRALLARVLKVKASLSSERQVDALKLEITVKTAAIQAYKHFAIQSTQLIHTLELTNRVVLDRTFTILQQPHIAPTLSFTRNQISDLDDDTEASPHATTSHNLDTEFDDIDDEDEQESRMTDETRSQDEEGSVGEDDDGELGMDLNSREVEVDVEMLDDDKIKVEKTDVIVEKMGTAEKTIEEERLSPSVTDSAEFVLGDGISFW